MPSDVEKQRARSRLQKEFEPLTQGGNPIDVQCDLRQAHALEFIAYRFGEIDKKLERLIEAIETPEAKS